MTLQFLAMFFLGAFAAGGVAWVFIYPILSGERQAEQRQASVARSEASARAIRGAPKPRREQVEETLKELEGREKRTRGAPLALRISQAGLTLSKRQFILISGGLGLASVLLGIGLGVGLLPAVGFGVVGGFGLPRWSLLFLKKRRQNRFLDCFPDAIDVITRGVKAGLPLSDCLRIVANEALEPVKSEFRSIVETQTIGMAIGEACGKLYENMPVPEANFFGIVIAIQQKAGGTLSEALGNLSRVLRERKRMKAKINAMSMEAKASATIIGALPLAVMMLVYSTSPSYIELLWTTQLGRIMLAGSAIWMSIGVLVMKKMINFDF